MDWTERVKWIGGGLEKERHDKMDKVDWKEMGVRTKGGQIDEGGKREEGGGRREERSV